MRRHTILSAILFALILPLAQVSIADESPTGTMAEIMIKLNHFPSEADVQSLHAIASGGDSSEAEIAVAMAIANLKHQATAADKEKLNALVADESAPAELRTLASVIVSTNHKPSAADIARLESIRPDS